MKFTFLLLLLPILSTAQTIHAEKDNIVYKGTVATPSLTAADVSSKLPAAVQEASRKSDARIKNQSTGNSLTWMEEMKLNSPYYKIHKLHFLLTLIPREGAYDYRVDSVSVTQQRRGGSTEVLTAKQLLKGIEETGAAAVVAEQLLNEIDMRLQKLIVLVENNVKGKK
jgi:hypothetical protein